MAVWMASASAAVTRAGPVDAKLVGTWARKVAGADVKRAGASRVPAGTVCTLVVRKSGVAHLACTNIGGFDGSLVPAGANRVDIELGLPDPDVYRWSVSGRLLTFRKVKDAVSDREAVMEGAWKRK